VNHVTAFAARAGRTVLAVWRYAKRHTPRWMIPVLAACLFIPGPIDELAVLAVVLVPVLKSREARHELGTAVSKAWNS